jgi:hypothetical protein
MIREEGENRRTPPSRRKNDVNYYFWKADSPRRSWSSRNGLRWPRSGKMSWTISRLESTRAIVYVVGKPCTTSTAPCCSKSCAGPCAVQESASHCNETPSASLAPPAPRHAARCSKSCAGPCAVQESASPCNETPSASLAPPAPRHAARCSKSCAGPCAVQDCGVSATSCGFGRRRAAGGRSMEDCGVAATPCGFGRRRAVGCFTSCWTRLRRLLRSGAVSNPS